MLFLKEFKKIVTSIPYLIFVAAIAIGLFSQGVFSFNKDPMQKPKPGENYGFKNEEFPEIIMPAALKDLLTEFGENNYTTYPIGLVKHVKLDENEKYEIAEIISEITGVDKTVILNESSDNSDNSVYKVTKDSMSENNEGGFIIDSNDKSEENSEKTKYSVRGNMSYSRFKELMKIADDILGGGSKYAVDSLIGYGAVPLTYEEALSQYDLAVKSDRVTGGYARLFADYAGIMAMSLMPVFPAIILCMKDRRARMDALIYTKKISAVKLTLARYLALVTSAMIPIIIMSYISNITVWNAHSEIILDYLAPLKYDFGWLLPSAMISAAIGMFLTELTGTPIAVVVQGLWWMLDINLGIKTIDSGYSLFRLAPRHNVGANSWFHTQDYLNNFQNLILNRALIAGVSIFLIALTILIYEAKRKGKFGGNISFKKAFSSIRNRSNKYKA